MNQNMFYKAEGSGVTAAVLCGSGELLQPAALSVETHEGAEEKHLPVVRREGLGIFVQVGSDAHPMTAEHSVEWVFLETAWGGQFQRLSGGRPEAAFALAEGETPVAAYAYCNRHGLWKTEIAR